MSANTKIGWTHLPGLDGHTWNPFFARRKDLNGDRGWACIKNSPGCTNCYAEDMNMAGFMGTGLAYTVPNLDLVNLGISDSGTSAIDWPLKTKKSAGIFPCSMTDWLGEFYPEQWSNYLLGVMCVSQHHVFLPLTKRPERLHQILNYWTLTKNALSLPDTKEFTTALVKAHGNYNKWDGGNQWFALRNNSYTIASPWPPPNIYFGATIVTQKEADQVLPILQAIHDLRPFKLWVSYEPALEVIDWNGYENLLSWIVVGGESGQNARRMSLDCVASTIGFGQMHNIPVYVKQFGKVLGEEMGLRDPKGIDIPEEYAIRKFPNIEGSYIPWK